jgi:hypothetical protein
MLTWIYSEYISRTTRMHIHIRTYEPAIKGHSLI